tara:strand:+ start:176 stop:571 length:396 start_codon:yes stop_codon:yes gene_type:complete
VTNLSYFTRSIYSLRRHKIAARVARGIIKKIAIVSNSALSSYMNAKLVAGIVISVKIRYMSSVSVRYMRAVWQSGQVKILPSTLSIGVLALAIGNFQPQFGHFLERFDFFASINVYQITSKYIFNTLQKNL